MGWIYLPHGTNISVSRDGFYLNLYRRKPEINWRRFTLYFVLSFSLAGFSPSAVAVTVTAEGWSPARKMASTEPL